MKREEVLYALTDRIKETTEMIYDEEVISDERDVHSQILENQLVIMNVMLLQFKEIGG